MADYRKSYMKRSLGLLTAVTPFAFAAASIILKTSPFLPRIAWGFLILSMLIGVLNFYLSFLRPLFWQKKHGSMRDYRFISGLPVIATLGACVAILTGFGSAIIAGLAIVVLAIDAGGFPWFVAATWSDQSLWDTEIQVEGEHGTGTNGFEP
jgi:hypothetical protein